MKPFEERAVFYQRTGQRNPQFCNSSFEGFLLFGVECWGVCGALAAEAIWVSSTSKVGQLVPVPLLMCWRGALCGGLRARLKGLRSLLGGVGVNTANKGGGQDLRAMWKLHLVHWPLRACAGRSCSRQTEREGSRYSSYTSPQRWVRVEKKGRGWKLQDHWRSWV